MGLTGYRCAACDGLFMPPRLYCPECGSDERHEVSFTGRGMVRVWTAIHVGPTRYEQEVPYTVVLVELEEGPRVMGRLEPGEKARIGAKLDLSSVDEKRGPVFRIADAGG
ncbi:MAG: OB-fold domain-containing protein [Chloroflexi bacterium]|nr:OB-fold domain-containing protein [Chloroflexota bacterium]MCY3937256.1 OB-fold domain-containing protein [Chloroflexota bacterium]